MEQLTERTAKYYGRVAEQIDAENANKVTGTDLAPPLHYHHVGDSVSCHSFPSGTLCCPGADCTPHHFS
uniref:Uncharacterized protein n=1 Tax=Knipowitschia caucasica TaxID=637954 RepID=A0AAV2LYW1_KNICA